MSRARIIGGALAGVLLTWLVAPHLFAEFVSVRQKVVRTDLAGSGEQVRVPIDADAGLDNLRSPFALIARVRNDAAASLVIRIAVDDREVCAAEMPARESRRIDCAVRDPWTSGQNHSVLFSSTSPRFTVEYLELATHFGALTPGPRNLIIGPRGFSASEAPSTWRLLGIFLLLTLSAWSVRHPTLPTVVSGVHLTLTAIVTFLFAAVIVSPLVSKYSLLIDARFLERLLGFTALPAFAAAAYVIVTRVVRPDSRPVIEVLAVGLVVGGVYLSFATHLVAERHAGNVSGLLLISHQFFDRNPMVNTRPEIERSLRFSDGGGYDGQYFYYMAFDPFLRVFRDRPRLYNQYIDGPPYRYGRIGFTFLTTVLSGNRPDRYPITMVSLVIAALALCGALLGAIAQRFGQSAWYGLLILIVPGFRQTVEATLPEPLAVAFFLGGYLCLLQQRWTACGVLLGMCLLVRETSGTFVLATVAGLAVAGLWRPAAIVASLAFLPLLAWKGFVGWVFWPAYGTRGLMPHPDDVGVPFEGIRQLWRTIARDRYWVGLWEMSRAGIAYPILTTAGGVLAVVAAVKRPSAPAAAAVFYGILTVTFNYKSVWLHPGNAQRLTIDLFVALALVGLQFAGTRSWISKAFTLFWCATVWYVFFGAFEASLLIDGLVSEIRRAF